MGSNEHLFNLNEKKEPDNRKFSVALPRNVIMKLEIAAAEHEVSTGIKTTRIDLIKVAVHEYIERRKL